MAFWFNCLLLLCIGVALTCGGTKKILLNDKLNQKGKFPLHDRVSKYTPALYCYKGIDRFTLEGLQKAWSGVHITLSDFENLVIIVGNSTESTTQSLVLGSAWNHEKFEIIFSPYETRCVGVRADFESAESGLTLDAKSKVLLYLPVMLLVGLLLFYVANSLSRSVALYYGGGVTIGILASVLILLYIFSKFVPKKNIIGLGIFAGGWAVFGTALYWFLENVQETLMQYWLYVLIYIVVAAVVSFAVLYRMGPISNPRTFDLIQWSIQLVGLGLMFKSSQIFELSVCICVLVTLSYLLPSRYNPLLLPFNIIYYTLYCLLYPLVLCWRCLSSPFVSPPRRRLLTKEEYEEQGRVETDKALNELRHHFQDMPNREMLNVLSRLKHSNRFSSFLNGSDHVSREEQVTHDWDFSADSSDEEDSDNDRGSSQHSSSMDSSFDHSPLRLHPSPSRPHPSPSRSIGQQSPHRMDSRLQYRPPTDTPYAQRYHTTF